MASRSAEGRDGWGPLRGALYALAAAALLVLAVGQIFTDRHEWSQWLWWTPRSVLAAAALPGAVVGVTRRGWATLWAVVGLIPLATLLIRDIGWRTWNPALQGLHIVHWNANWPGSTAGAVPAKLLLDRNADVVIVSNAYKLLADGRAEVWREHGYEMLNTGTFLVASRWPLVEARNVSGNEGRIVGVIRLDIGGTRLTICAVDLPSDARLSRMRIAEELAAETHLPSPVEADCVVGDFNITRGSASIQRMFPGFREAFDVAGVGYGATWPRRLPLLQLDHMLVSGRLAPLQYRIFDLGSRVHCAHEMVVRWPLASADASVER